MNIKTKKMTLPIILILILALSTLAAFSQTNAQTYTWVANTWAYISVTPNPAAVNRPLIVLMFLDAVPPDAAGPQGSRWQNWKCNIVDPTGKNTTKGPYSSDDVAGAWFMYNPTMIGNYTFQWSWPGQDINMSGTLRHYYGSMSKALTVSVQEDIAPGFQSAPLPTGYWTRPIYGLNREWAEIAGNWFTNAYNSTSRSFDAGTAISPNAPPLSAHILWTKPETLGGILGQGYGGNSFYTGYSYEAMFKPPIILGGKLYYNTFQPPRYGFKCVDLATGQEVWYQNLTVPNATAPASLAFGQILDYESPNQHGGVGYLWATRTVGSGGSQQSYWDMFDANTGNYILTINMTGVSGTQVYSSYGELLRYSIAYNTTLQTQTVMIWNSSKAIPPSSAAGSGFWQWRPDSLRGQVLNGTVNRFNMSCYETPIPIQNITGQSISTFAVDAVIVSSGAYRIGYDFATWKMKWMSNFTRRTDYPQNYTVSGTVYGEDGLMAEYIKQTMQWYGYDLKTGQPTWGPTDPYENDMGLYNFQMSKFYYKGLIINAGYDGIVHAINMTTGETVWEFYSGQATDWDLPYGTWPFYSGQVATGGYIFAQNGEHSPTSPTPRGEKMFCIDAKTGLNVWNISGVMQQPVVADQKLLALNGYDNQIYCFGKGPSATTVDAAPAIISKGSAVMIKGTVTDQTPKFKGTAAIADDYMGKWMEYLAMQQPIPGDAVGVTVKLTAFDPNGNPEDIGTVTSDMSGMFYKMWTPQSEGEYKIIATFEGTNSYGGSYAETAIGVSSAPSASPTASPPTAPTPTPPSVTPTPTPSPSPSQPEAPKEGTPTEMYIIAASVVIIIALAAIAAVVLRRRK